MSLGSSARPEPICAASWPSSGTQMALALHRVGLTVRAAHQHHVAIEVLEHLFVDVGDVLVELRRRDPLAFGGEQLSQLSATFTCCSQTGDHLFRGRLGCYRGRSVSRFRVRPLFGRHALFSSVSVPLAAACGGHSDCTGGTGASGPRCQAIVGVDGSRRHPDTKISPMVSRGC
jgi:hypothetical protein